MVPLPGRGDELAPPFDNCEDLVNSDVKVVLNRGGGEVEGPIAALDGVVQLLAVDFETLSVLAFVIGVAVHLDGHLVLSSTKSQR